MAGTGNADQMEDGLFQSQPVVLDALPYIDAVNEEYEAYALNLIEEEMKAIAPPTLPKVKITSTPQSEMLKNELAELTEDRNRKIADYVTPSRPQRPDSNSDEDWRLAVLHSRSEHESERIRSTVLEAEKTASGSQWQLWLEQLQGAKQGISRKLDSQRSKVDEINASRQKFQQNETGEKLRVLTTKLQERLYTKHQLAIAKKELQAEVDAMKLEVSSMDVEKTNNNNT
mmetsp:Transcript_16169/g.22552  ORF Transcript_16169/g.22552 Transcript_16169/m.22552 type:complete len:229 (-) Transcript_16169:27-713(-)